MGDEKEGGEGRMGRFIKKLVPTHRHSDAEPAKEEPTRTLTQSEQLAQRINSLHGNLTGGWLQQQANAMVRELPQSMIFEPGYGHRTFYSNEGQLHRYLDEIARLRAAVEKEAPHGMTKEDALQRLDTAAQHVGRAMKVALGLEAYKRGVLYEVRKPGRSRPNLMVNAAKRMLEKAGFKPETIVKVEAMLRVEVPKGHAELKKVLGGKEPRWFRPKPRRPMA